LLSAVGNGLAWRWLRPLRRSFTLVFARPAYQWRDPARAARKARRLLEVRDVLRAQVRSDADQRAATARAQERARQEVIGDQLAAAVDPAAVAEWGRAVSAAYVTAGLDQGWADLYHDIATRPTTPNAEESLQPPGAGAAAGVGTSHLAAPVLPAPPSTPEIGRETAHLDADGKTLSRLKGIPATFQTKFTRGLGGHQYVDPSNSGNYIRVMPGDPKSEFEASRHPYVRWQKNGQPLDINGDQLSTKHCAEAHIPLADFKILPEVFE
jgi:hypothetical protein